MPKPIDLDVTIKNNEPWLKQNPSGMKSQQIALKGEWSLDDAHQLLYRLKGQHSKRYWRKIVFETELIEAKDDCLVLSVTHQVTHQRRRTQIVELTGFWRLDRFNRLRFDVKRKTSSKDELRFDLAWSLNKQMHLVYRVDRKSQSTRNLLTIKGQWHLINECYLAYEIKGQQGREMRARAFLQTKEVRAKKGELRYRLGIGFYKKDRVPQEISLLGTWNLSRRLSVNFILSKGEKRTYTFRMSSAHFAPRKISFSVRLSKRQSMRLRLQVDRFFFPNSQAFIVWSRDMREKAELKLGVRVSF